MVTSSPEILIGKIEPARYNLGKLQVLIYNLKIMPWKLQINQSKLSNLTGTSGQ